MSKKLLMNNRSDSGLSPTQNGLVCWLDAFDLTNFELSTVWLDRTNNNNDATVCYLPVVESVGNGILHAKTAVNIPNPTKGLSQYTVEVGYQDVTNRYWLGLWGNTSDFGDGYFKGLSLYQQENGIGGYPISINVASKNGIQYGKNYITATINSNELTIYHNGERLSFNNLTTQSPSKQILPSEANYFCFMGRKPNNANEESNTSADMISAKWYFLRIYNRVLTQEEILANYNYELSLTRGE